MKNMKIAAIISGMVLALNTGFAYGEDAEVKLNSNDGTTKFIVQDKDALTVFSADSDGNIVLPGLISASSMTTAGAGVIFSTNIFVTQGSVGIGTTSPAALFVLSKNRTNGSTYVQEILDAQTMSNTAAGSGIVTGYSRGDGGSYYGAVGGYANGAAPGIGLWAAPAVVSGAISAGPNLFIDSGGSVGIGTTVPQQKLQVNASGANSYLRISGDAANQQGLEFFDTVQRWAIYKPASTTDLRFFNGAGDILTIQNGGNVGIGSTAPGARLEIKSSGLDTWVLNAAASDGSALGGLYEDNAGDGQFYLRNAAGTARVFFESGGNQGVYDYINTGNNLGIGTAGPGANLHISSTSASTAQDMLKVTTGTTNADVFVVKGSGNVGIGTAAPGYKLHVKDDSNAVVGVLESNAGGVDNVQLRFKGTSGERWAIGNNVATGGTGVNFDIYDLVALTNRVRIDGDGNVGIGTAFPTHKLHVTGNAIFTSSASVSGTGLSGTDPAFQVIGGTLTVLANGNVGIGTIVPGDKLDVKGAVRLQNISGGAGSLRLFTAVTVASQDCATACGAITLCMGAWTSAGSASACGTLIAGNRCLCAAFGD